MALKALITCFAAVSAEPRSAEPRVAPCIPAEGSCHPALDRCCQGPGLMTCRLRMNVKDTGMAYKCGSEFSHQLTSKCVPEGDVCEPDSQQCCQVDVKRPMSCTLPSKAEGKAKPTCMAKGQDFLGETACVAEGSSCNPLENTCCQGPEKGQALLTCQLKFSERPGVRSPAYVCSKEFSPSLFP